MQNPNCGYSGGLDATSLLVSLLSLALLRIFFFFPRP